ncbi:MAG: D-2-hydroxyacid dehydrogenase [Candidatus Limnocylindrales bacterium]
MSDRIRVRCVYPFMDDDIRMLASVDPRIELVSEGEDTPEWCSTLDDPDLEVLLSNHLPADLDRVPALRWLHTASAGLDMVLAQDPWGHGITVTNGSGVHAVHMGEYVLGAVMLWSERLAERLAHQHAGRWDREIAVDTLPGRRLRGRTAVIVGYGSLGREVGRLLHALGVRIIAVKADPTTRADHGWREPGTGDPEGVLPERFAGPADLSAVVREADIVVLTLPATPRTTRIVDAAVLTAMRRDALLVNVGRGALVDQDALIEALAGRRIGAAVLDVTDPEPLPDDSPLWTLPGTLVTPHISALGEVTALWHTAALLCAENLRRYVAGEPLLNVTSPAAGY